MTAFAALLLFCAAAPAATIEAASPFDAGYVASVKQSLAGDPFFASKLLASFDFHLQAAAAAPDARTAALGLAAAISPDRNLKTVAARLGQEPVHEAKAGALLAASALAAPSQFERAASRLEAVKPGLGARLVESLRGVGGDARLAPPALTYGRDGKLDWLFDGER